MVNYAKFDVVFSHFPNSWRGFQQAFGEAVAATSYSYQNWEFQKDGNDIIIVDSTDPTRISARIEGIGLALDGNGRPTGNATAVTVLDPATGNALSAGSFSKTGIDITRLISEVLDRGPFYGTPLTNPTYYDFLHAGNKVLIEGSNKSDILIGYGPDDVLLGLKGNDYFQFYDSVKRIDGGAGKKDAIDFYTRDTPINVDLNAGTITVNGNTTKVRGVEVIHAGNKGDTLRSDPNKAEVLYGYGGNDRIFCGSDDKVFAGRGADRVVHVGDNAVLWGQGGNDRIVVTGNGNKIFGGRGDDSLIVKSGTSAVLRGGPGVDNFEFRKNYADAYHEILDYENGEVISLTGINGGSPDANLVEKIAQGSDTLIRFVDPADNSLFEILVVGVAPTDVTLGFD